LCESENFDCGRLLDVSPNRPGLPGIGGHEVIEAADGETALNRYSVEKPILCFWIL
jgi:hypothetical protein